MLTWLLAIIPTLAMAQQGSIGIDKYGGLNDYDSPAVIQPFEAQDALNVETNLSGTSIMKRKGFDVSATMTLTTAPISGAFTFYDSNNNRHDVVCQDVYCFNSTNQGAFSAFLSTATRPTRWSFVSVNYKLYGANDSRDPVFQYDGTGFSNPSGIPRGSLLELSKDRLIVSDTSANPNRVSYSQSGVFTNFTTGINSEDPYFDDIGSPGDRVTALKFDRGRLYIAKRETITVCLLGDQYTSNCALFSRSVGSVDQESFISAPDALYFRGQDRQFWKIGADGLEPASLKIRNTLSSGVSGSIRTNTQSSKPDWDAGIQYPTGTWNTTTTNGSIFVSSFSLVDITTMDFYGGSLVRLTSATVMPYSRIGLASNTASGFTLYERFETGAGSFANGWISYSATPNKTAGVCTTGTCLLNGNPIEGVYSSSMTTNNSGDTFGIDIYNVSGTTVVSRNESVGPFCDTNLGTQTINTQAYYGSQLRIHLSNQSGSDPHILSPYFTARTSITFQCQVGLGSPGAKGIVFDNFQLADAAAYFSSGSILSRAFYTGFSTPTPGSLIVSSVVPEGTALSFQVRGASSPWGNWGQWWTLANGSTMTLIQPYWQYFSSFTTIYSTKTPSITQVTLTGDATGQYVTQCIQPGSGITSFGIISCAESNTGNATMVYSATSAPSCAAINYATTTFVSQTNNTALTIATNTAVMLSFRPLLTAATETAQVDACTIYWNNGTVAPPTWGKYDSGKNSIYWTVAVASSTTNNRTIKYDLNVGQWYPFDIQANPMLILDNSLYFGSSIGGYWNKYGDTDNDNGAAINAYWKSKDFSQDPFVEKNFQKISLIARNQGSGTLNVTYTLSNSTTGVYAVGLGTTTGIQYIRNNYNIPIASPQTFMSLKFGNNAANQPFEVLGSKIDYFAQPWRPIQQ